MKRTIPSFDIDTDLGRGRQEPSLQDYKLAAEQEAALNRLLRVAAGPASQYVALSECLDILLEVSWLALLPRGGVFLVGENPEVLELYISKNFPPELETLCEMVPFGHCLCGRVAAQGKTLHTACIDDLHDINFEGMLAHGHYVTPIVSGGRVLGVIVLYLPDGHVSDERELPFLESVADIFAMILKKQKYKEGFNRSARLGKILENSLNEIYIFDPETLKFQLVNRGARENLGFDLDALRSMTPYDLKPEYSEAEFRRKISPLIDGHETSLQFEACHQRKDGSIYPVDVNLQYISDGTPVFAAIINDITAHKKAEARLRTAEQTIAQAVDSFPGGFTLFDKEDRLQIFNDSFVEMYPSIASKIEVGVTFTELLWHFVEAHCPEDARGREKEWVEARVALHHQKESQHEFQLENGAWISVAEKRLENGDYVSFRLDITELKKQQAELELAREVAERSNRAKSEFLATISHEIRTPLNGIIGMAQLLSDESEDSEIKEKSRIILESGDALNVIINDILDVSNIEAGQLRIIQENFEPGALANKISALHAHCANHKGLDFDVFVSSNVDVPYEGDPERITQILHNLVANAIKFTESGRVEVFLNRGKDGGLFLKVQDTGIGMTQSQKKRVFDDFVQADNTISRRYSGTGLGLGIVRRLTKLMGGSFELDSVHGEGTTATVFLPLARASQTS